MTDQWCGTIYEILIECIMRNNPVKLFWIWVGGSGEDAKMLLFKIFLSVALAVLLFGKAEPFLQFWKRAWWAIFMWSYTEFGPVVRRRCRLKTFSYLELLQSICSADQNHLCNFGRRYHEEQFCEVILNWTSGSGGNSI